MPKKPFIFFMLIFCVTGCSPVTEKSRIRATIYGDRTSFIDVQACINEADVLSKINSKYNEDISHLHKLITDIKYYASISNKISSHSEESVTRYYELNVYNACDAISQSLISELKAKAISTSNK